MKNDTKHIILFLILLISGFSIAQPNVPKPIKKSYPGLIWSIGLGDIIQVKYSPEGRNIAVATEINIRIQEGESLELIHELWGHTGSVNTIDWSPDSRYIVSGSDDKTLKMWDTETGKEVPGFVGSGHEDAVTSVSFSPDGRFIVSGSADKKLKLWDARTGEEISGFGNWVHTAGVNSVVFSPDGRHIISGSDDETLKLWDAWTGAEVKDFAGTGHTGVVSSVSFSPDGRFIVSGSEDNTLKLWNAKTGEEISGFGNWVHSAGVNSVVFSPDGRYIVSGSDDKTIKLWDVWSGKEVPNFDGTGHTGAVSSVSFSPDGRLIVSGSNDDTIKLWDAKTGIEIPGVTVTQPVPDITLDAHIPDERYDIKRKVSTVELTKGPEDIVPSGKKFSSGPYVEVTADRANIRKGPSLGHDIIHQARQGDKFQYIHKQKRWYEVSVGDKSGWVHETVAEYKKITKPTEYSLGLPPILAIEDISFSEYILDADETAQLSITIKNIGMGDAKDLYVELSGYLEGLSFPKKTTFPPIANNGDVKTVAIDIKGETNLPTSEAEIDIIIIEPYYKIKIKAKHLKFLTRKIRTPKLVITKFTVLENISASPNNQIDLYEQIEVKFVVQNVGQGNAEEVFITADNNQKGVLFLGIGEKYDKDHPYFPTIPAGNYRTISYHYFVNSEFNGDKLNFLISASERRGKYGFEEEKSVAINTDMRE